MLLAVDVHYGARGAITAAVGFRAWPDSASILEHVTRSDEAPAPYVPGAFYERELPRLLEIIAQVHRGRTIEAIVVDGHVWLGAGVPGMGARLHEALGGRSVVLGVAKSAYAAGVAIPVRRGKSARPLFVTAAGLEAVRAAECVRSMHGPHRIPTLLRLTDQLARGLRTPDPVKAPVR